MTLESPESGPHIDPAVSAGEFRVISRSTLPLIQAAAGRLTEEAGLGRYEALPTLEQTGRRGEPLEESPWVAVTVVGRKTHVTLDDLVDVGEKARSEAFETGRQKEANQAGLDAIGSVNLGRYRQLLALLEKL